MSIERKTERGRIDPESEIDHKFISDITEAVQIPHRHHYFEVFLITHGSVEHKINGVSQVLFTGFMALARPDDIHCLIRRFALM